MPSIKLNYNIIQLVSNMVPDEAFGGIMDNEMKHKCHITHHIIKDMYDPTRFDNFVNKHLSSVTDYLTLAFKMIIACDDIVMEVLTNLTEPEVYSNEGQYLYACSVTKDAHKVLTIIAQAKDYFESEDTIYTWRRHTIDKNGKLCYMLEVILEKGKSN